nr:choline/ethanolaminephosphotransferase 1 isoform X1 [Ipomoea trifida]
MGYIGAHGVAALHRYKYSGEDRSYVAKYILQPFWRRCVNFFPLWMPPNMITLTGFMFLVTSALLGYIYSPQLDSPPPRWVNFAHGLLLFLYQTFDAVDGKQARRTNSSSPLGELFDHGCDALACTFESIAFGSTSMCGADAFWFWVISAVPFYCATWEHYFTNTLILPVINGPTEGLMLIYLSHFFTALVGAEWWAQQFGKSIPFLSWVPFLNGEITQLECVHNVYKVVQARRGSMLLALAMLYPFTVLLGGVLVWDYISPNDLMGNYPHLVIVGTGLAFGFLVSLLYLPFAIANTLTARINGGIPLVDEFWVLLGYCVYSGKRFGDETLLLTDFIDFRILSRQHLTLSNRFITAFHQDNEERSIAVSILDTIRDLKPFGYH